MQAGKRSEQRWLVLALGAIAVALSGCAEEGTLGERPTILERVRGGLGSVFDRPLLRYQQKGSLDIVYSVGTEPVTIPGEDEVSRYRELRTQFDVEALTYLDDLYGSRDALKALALRDSDRDSVPDFRVSDYYGKFMEGDVDLDGDGVRNLYDTYAFDESRGGRDGDGDGIPDADFPDQNANGLPDAIDWSIHKERGELSTIQLELFRDYKILLVERNASFDLPLARAVDDAIRRVFRAYFEEHPVMPTLRTIATERTALLNALLAYVAEDDTSAQVIPQTQSLIVYNEGREVEDDIGLLGLLVHEMGHNYTMSLDFDEEDIVTENGRIDFPAPNFVELVKPFGWTTNEYFDGDIGVGLPVVPRFAYTGMSEPVFAFRGETPEEWAAWVDDIYEELDGSPTYLHDATFGEQGIVGDYSLSAPYEWYGDNFIAYVVSVIEEEALESFAADSSRATVAKKAVNEALLAIWPGFYHRNLAPEVRAYFERTFPISEPDRRALAKRYIDPIVGAN